MEKLKLVKSAVATQPGDAASGTDIARVTDAPENGWLELVLASGDRVRARILQSLADRPAESLLGREVLVAFPGSKDTSPVVLDLLHDPDSFAEALLPDHDADQPLHAEINGKTVTIKAEERLVLRVGKASIVIDDQGKITIRGAHLLNRATGPIRIKGGHVDIN